MMEKYQIAAITVMVLGFLIFADGVASDSCTTTIAKTHVERVE